MQQEQLNQIMPGWVLIRKLGQGSYGGVYEIQRKLPGGKIEKAALKHVMIPKNQDDVDVLLAQSYTIQSISEHYQTQLQKLIQEYSIMRELSECPNIVGCQDVSYLPNGYGWELFIRMELLMPMKQTIDNQFRELEVLRLGLEMCNALRVCREHNIIHRDIKPENILVSEDGTYKLADFGIAKTSEKTQTGTMAGTYGYMAPEVANRQHYGSGADIYSLGMVLYWLCNNKTFPFLPLPPQIPTAAQRQQSLSRRFSGESLPPPLYGSSELKEIILKACAFSPDDRFRSVDEFSDSLKNVYQAKKTSDSEILEELGLPATIFNSNQEDFGDTPAFLTEELEPDYEQSERKSTFPKILAVGVLALAVTATAFGWHYFRSGKEETDNVSATESSETASLIEYTEPSAIEETQEESATLEETIAETIPEPVIDFLTETNDSGITIIGVNGVTPADITIPESIDGKQVTQIGKNAFASNTTIKSISLPSNVTTIGEKAFYGCTKLQNVTFPSGLKQIETSAFENSSLTKLSLPDGIERIGTWAFANCKRLTEIIIPNSVTQLSEWAFSGCTTASSLTIGNGLSEIGNYAFYDCQRLTTVSIPDGVHTIDVGAFANCSQLSSVTIPDSMRTISTKAFENTAISSVTINPLCSVGDSAFPLGCAINNR